MVRLIHLWPDPRTASVSAMVEAPMKRVLVSKHTLEILTAEWIEATQNSPATWRLTRAEGAAGKERRLVEITLEEPVTTELLEKLYYVVKVEE